jgi:hypothetical protein
MKPFIEWLHEANNELAESKWIQKAIKHPGRCTPAPNPDCPVGSPQYNLAQRFKKGDIHKANEKKDEKPKKKSKKKKDD